MAPQAAPPALWAIPFPLSSLPAHGQVHCQPVLGQVSAVGALPSPPQWWPVAVPRLWQPREGTRSHADTRL